MIVGSPALPYVTLVAPAVVAPEPDDAVVPEERWAVTVTVPASLHESAREALFRVVADAVHGWEPAERPGWDADVAAGPAAPADPTPAGGETGAVSGPRWWFGTVGGEVHHSEADARDPAVPSSAPDAADVERLAAVERLARHLANEAARGHGMPPYADETWAHVRHAWLPQARAALAAVGVLRDGAAAPDHRIIDAPCPKCGVTPGEDCWDRAGGHPRSPHPTRVEAVRRAATPSGDTGSRA